MYVNLGSLEAPSHLKQNSFWNSLNEINDSAKRNLGWQPWAALEWGGIRRKFLREDKLEPVFSKRESFVIKVA